MTLATKIIDALKNNPGSSDRTLSEFIFGTPHRSTQINGECRHLENIGRIERKKIGVGPIGSYLVRPKPVLTVVQSEPDDRRTMMTEDQVKVAVKASLESAGWEATVAWGRSRGTDMVATRGEKRWIIECKGAGSLPPMQNNYFLTAIGELIQRMNVSCSKHSVAFPDLPKYRRLWSELPVCVKKQISLTALFVSENGAVLEVDGAETLTGTAAGTPAMLAVPFIGVSKVLERTNMRRQDRSPMQFLMDYLRRNLLLNSSVADLYVSIKASRVSSGSKDNSKPSRQQSGIFTRIWEALTRQK